MAWGMSDCGFTHREILQKVLFDLEKEELRMRKSTSSDLPGILKAMKIVKKHMAIDYE